MTDISRSGCPINLSLEVLGIILAGYSSGSKWSLFGGMREAAQMVSYEVPLGITAVIPVLIAGMYAPRSLGAAYYEKFDAIYPALAKDYGHDLYPFFLDGVLGDTSLNLDDGMHPSHTGVERIVEGILPAVETFLGRIKTAS